MTRTVRRLIVVLAVTVTSLLVVIVVAIGLLWGAAKMALPTTNGNVVVAGLESPVTVMRDQHGIPLIHAATADDAYFALGYVHAQDRLFEMEMMRRQGQGRLAEVIGPMGLAPDRLMRTLGVYRRTEADLTTLAPDVQRAFTRYSDGVNAWLAEGHALPLEFRLLWFKPEPWKPADSLVWQKLMGLELTSNWDEELFQAALIDKLGSDRAAALMPSPPANDPITVSARAENFDGLRVTELLDTLSGILRPTLASNEWVIAGSRTDTGKPLLANDPHLGFQAPSIWYLAGIETPDFKVFGATIPGVPLHVLGHNEAVAWGFTTTHSDTSDLFVEQLTDDGQSYQTPDGPTAFVTRQETINVRWSQPATITVRESRHGPVVSDVLPRGAGDPDLQGQHRVLALSAAILAPNDHTGEAVYRMDRAASVDDFIEALKLFDAPQQNIVAADTAGNIAYYAPGRVPMRKAGDGSVPAPGWSGTYDWTGWVPFEGLPHSVNPTRGFLVNANNKMVADDYPYLLTAHWMDAYRASRISSLTDKDMPSSVMSTKATQQDDVSLMAREMLPLLVAHAGDVPPKDRGLIDALARWDGTMDRARWEPVVFGLWMEFTKHAVLADKLGPLYRQFGGARPEVLRDILERDSAWCANARQPATKACDAQVAQAWSDVLAWLRDHGIQDPKRIVKELHWGDFHVATFGHILFQYLPAPLNRLGMIAIPSNGDGYTINRGSYLPATAVTPFRHVHGATYRAIYDLADLSRSQFALGGGQSGAIGSPHYGDLVRPWRDGNYFSAPIAGDATDTLTLRPAAGAP